MQIYQTALILGYGKSGQAAQTLLESEGVLVSIFDESSDSLDDLKNALKEVIFDVCIVSPGFALDHPWLMVVRGAHIPLLAEIELGWSRFLGQTIAVTGSNGKSSTVKWLAEILKIAGKKVAIAGNYGIPVSQVVMEQPDLDFMVLEVSSFQLETTKVFRPNIAVFLNLLPNHLNRHQSMDNYRWTKSRIFEYMQDDDVCIVQHKLLSDVLMDLSSKPRNFVTFGDNESDFFYENGVVYSDHDPVINLMGTFFGNSVYGENTGAAVAAVLSACKIELSLAEKAAKEYESLPHRMQEIAVINGVRYINDSKATNFSAMAAAVSSFGKRTYLIAGGQSKESDFTFMKEILAEHTMKIYLIGQASREMFLAWSQDCQCVECGTLEEAFQRACQVAKKGDTILLSPGCASFDQFKNFEHRGEAFVKLVEGLRE